MSWREVHSASHRVRNEVEETKGNMFYALSSCPGASWRPSFVYPIEGWLSLRRSQGRTGVGISHHCVCDVGRMAVCSGAY
jgi:hypothetical protein